MAEQISLYRGPVCIAGAGIADVEPEISFKIFVVNFRESSYNLVTNQHILTAEQRPTGLIESHICKSEMM